LVMLLQHSPFLALFVLVVCAFGYVLQVASSEQNLVEDIVLSGQQDGLPDFISVRVVSFLKDFPKQFDTSVERISVKLQWLVKVEMALEKYNLWKNGEENSGLRKCYLQIVDQLPPYPFSYSPSHSSFQEPVMVSREYEVEFQDEVNEVVWDDSVSYFLDVAGLPLYPGNNSVNFSVPAPYLQVLSPEKQVLTSVSLEKDQEVIISLYSGTGFSFWNGILASITIVTLFTVVHLLATLRVKANMKLHSKRRKMLLKKQEEEDKDKAGIQRFKATKKGRKRFVGGQPKKKKTSILEF